MLEITFNELQENFEEIMNKIENENLSYFVILPDGNRVMLVPHKNEIIDRMENEGLIEKYEE